ncbi:MAG: hypothetical protein NTU59_01330 [Coprothermobacterota bacterium]|nr:hypothetical protein [Coprothermobacterota bacterium]
MIRIFPSSDTESRTTICRLRWSSLVPMAVERLPLQRLTRSWEWKA